MRDRASWFFFGIGQNVLGDMKCGRWEYYIDNDLLSHVQARWRLQTNGFNVNEAEAYLEALRKAYK